MIASIKAFDRDRGDPGRLQYFVLGPSSLHMDSTNGTVYLTGALDAETQSEIVFHSYARDLSPAPSGMSSKLQEFRIKVTDVNEFKPVIQPTIVHVNIKENDRSLLYPDNFIPDIEIECYDRDFNSTLHLALNSIRYVSIFKVYRLLYFISVD